MAFTGPQESHLRWGWGQGVVWVWVECGWPLSSFRDGCPSPVPGETTGREDKSLRAQRADLESWVAGESPWDRGPHPSSQIAAWLQHRADGGETALRFLGREIWRTVGNTPFGWRTLQSGWRRRGGTWGGANTPACQLVLKQTHPEVV